MGVSVATEAFHAHTPTPAPRHNCASAIIDITTKEASLLVIVRRRASTRFLLTTQTTSLAPDAVGPQTQTTPWEVDWTIDISMALGGSAGHSDQDSPQLECSQSMDINIASGSSTESAWPLVAMTSTQTSTQTPATAGSVRDMALGGSMDPDITMASNGSAGTMVLDHYRPSSCIAYGYQWASG